MNIISLKGGSPEPPESPLATGLYIANSTLVPEAICCCLQTSTYFCFYQGGEIYMYRNFRSQNFYTFLVIWTHVLYYNVLPEAIFVVYIKFFRGDLPAMNICLHAKFQVRWCYSFGSTALQQD